jgi:hypothetical protein
LFMNNETFYLNKETLFRNIESMRLSFWKTLLKIERIFNYGQKGLR